MRQTQNIFIPIYLYQYIKYFWVRAKVIDKRVADEELRRARAKDPMKA